MSKVLGKEVTLKKADDSVLCDYIVGKQVEGETNQYYVRHPDEDEVYIADLEIDLTTKFTSWIDTDLLEVSSSDLKEIVANNYSFDESNRTIREVLEIEKNKEVTKLVKNENNWTVDGLEAETEEANTESIDKVASTIADLKIVGVRPKREGLTPELQLDRKAIKSQDDLNDIMTELQMNGFVLMPGPGGDQDKLQLLGQEGELVAGTNDGIVYRLLFGRVVTGTNQELEIGFSSDSSEEKEVG